MRTREPWNKGGGGGGCEGGKPHSHHLSLLVVVVVVVVMFAACIAGQSQSAGSACDELRRRTNAQLELELGVGGQIDDDQSCFPMPFHAIRTKQVRIDILVHRLIDRKQGGGRDHWIN